MIFLKHSVTHSRRFRNLSTRCFQVSWTFFCPLLLLFSFTKKLRKMLTNWSQFFWASVLYKFMMSDRKLRHHNHGVEQPCSQNLWVDDPRWRRFNRGSPNPQTLGTRLRLSSSSFRDWTEAAPCKAVDDAWACSRSWLSIKIVQREAKHMDEKHPSLRKSAIAH